MTVSGWLNVQAADGLPGRRYLDVRRVRRRHFPPVLRRGLQGVEKAMPYNVGLPLARCFHGVGACRDPNTGKEMDIQMGECVGGVRDCRLYEILPAAEYVWGEKLRGLLMAPPFDVVC